MTTRHLPGKHNQDSHGGEGPGGVAESAGKALGKMTEDDFFAAHGDDMVDEYGGPSFGANLWADGTASLYRNLGKGKVQVFADVDSGGARRLAVDVKWAAGKPDSGEPSGGPVENRRVDLGPLAAEVGYGYDGQGDKFVRITMPPVGGDRKPTLVDLIDLDQVDELVDDLEKLADDLAANDGAITDEPPRSAIVKEVDMAVSTAMRPNAEQHGLAERSVPFEMDASRDGLTLEGYAAVFDMPTSIDSWEGRFDEVIARGAFEESLRQRMPVLMFEHGKHPLIGTMPLGVIVRAAEDSKGLHIEARLSDNWLIQPVRDAVRDKAVTGMSFRFSVLEGGDKWERRSGKPDLRTVLKVAVPELGPVVFPAYEPTTATVRSLVERLPDLTRQPDARSAGGGDPGARPGNGERPTVSDRTRADDDALRLRGIK